MQRGVPGRDLSVSQPVPTGPPPPSPCAAAQAGLGISGINAEVMPGQWEFQIGPVGALEVGDQVRRRPGAVGMVGPGWPPTRVGWRAPEWDRLFAVCRLGLAAELWTLLPLCLAKSASAAMSKCAHGAALWPPAAAPATMLRLSRFRAMRLLV